MMTLEIVLRIGAIAVPLVGAFVLWRWAKRGSQPFRGFPTAVLLASGIITLTLFFTNRLDACLFSSGRQSCFLEGLGMLSLISLNFIFARASMNRREESEQDNPIRFLLFSGAWAGIVLSEHLILYFVFLYLLAFVIIGWLKKRGYRGGFLKLRDDDDDRNDKSDPFM
ncbi:MAG: hypothetical protein GYA48_10335 [Chloroflexi bacterium]|nr:hypothetical protein [Chloroflexota bacterium]